MNNVFSPEAWEEYLYWFDQNDRKTIRKINTLLKDINRNGHEGLGKPEPLVGDLSGYWSRRISREHRLIYCIDGDNILIARCRDHYK
jgi:toxin YoeB